MTRQHDSMQCGAACLAMICSGFGKKISLQHILNHCTPTNEGISMKGISDAAKELGLDSIASRISLANLKSVPMPCILHWNQNHFVVLYHINKSGTKFWIADPGKGKYKCSTDEMRKHWISTQKTGIEKGIGMFFETTEKFNSIKDDNGPEHSSEFLFGYIKQYKRYFLQILLGLALGSISKRAKSGTSYPIRFAPFNDLPGQAI